MGKKLIRACIEKLHAYTPGEQPKISGLTKLNTNENPYPPSPRVLQAIRGELDQRLRLYPNPTSDRFRQKVASVYRFRLNQVIAGNGSDDILTLAIRAFVDEKAWVQFPKPTYSLYPVLTQIQHGKVYEVPFRKDFSLSLNDFRKDAALTFIANPNAPSGTSISPLFLKRLAKRLNGVLLIDEAYADFASGNCLGLARSLKNVLVSRTFSKSFSLAGMRLGFAVGPEKLIEAMMKVKDSYNVDRLAQAAGEAALSDPVYYKKCIRKVLRTREKFRGELERRGWFVFPSQANFLFAKPPRFPAKDWLQKLRAKKILVRWFSSPETRDYLRITIGTDREMNYCLSVVDELQPQRFRIAI
jgi:histidinol-phosphate aminotransferase